MDDSHPHPVRVLVADDHGLVRNALVNLLNDVDDVEVVGVASDGVEAVALAHAKHPQVVVMDLQMPRMDGVEATRAILADEPDTKIVVLTGYSDLQRAEQARLAGAVAYLLKEHDPKSLVQSILASVFATW